MILALLDDGTLEICDTPTALVASVEPLDAEESLREVFDENARPYKVKWIKPNVRGRCFLGILRFVENGEYELVPAGPPNEPRLLDIIKGAVAIHPRSAEARVRDLERRLRRTQTQN
jgi:hypothetical protein